MQIREITDKEGMLKNFDVLSEFYPALTMEEYDRELDEMIPHNYGQVGVFEDGKCLGMTGYWIGNKLWCGKYMELDNVAVLSVYRSKGIGKMLFEYMQNKAEELGCTMMALDTYTDNFKAHKFFYQQGYVPRGFHFINVLKKDKIR